MHKQPDNNDVFSLYFRVVQKSDLCFPINVTETVEWINPNQVAQLSGPSRLLDTDFG